MIFHKSYHLPTY